MKLNNSELASEPLLGQEHTSPPPLPPRNNPKSAVVLGRMSSLSLKSSKSDPQQAISRIHCIPLLMLSVFLILWAASSEVLPSTKTTTHAMSRGMKSSETSELEVKSTASTNDVNLQPSGRKTVVDHQHDSSSQSNDPVGAAASLRANKRSRDKLPGKAHLRGNGKT